MVPSLATEPAAPARQEESPRRPAIARLLNPASIAIVGTSPAGGRGRNVHRNLQHFGYSGRLYAVNPKYQDVLDTPCYPSVADLPEAVDCAIVAVPADPAIEVVEQCAALGVGGAILFAGGFAEMGGEGVERQERLRDIADRGQLAICGPNCFGLMNIATSTVAFSGSVGSILTAGPVALVSQSGGLSLEVASTLVERGVGLTHVVSCGNEAATTLEEYLDYLVDEPEVGLLAIVVEGFKRPALFLSVARRAVERQKPIVLLKLGRSQQGRRAVASHTGSLAGDDRVLSAVVQRYGISRVSTVDEMVETTVALARRNWPGSGGVVFVSGSGGRSALMADVASEAGVPLAEYAPETWQALRALLPRFASVDNPLDLTGAMYDQEGIYSRALSLVAQDPRVGMLAVYQGARPAGRGMVEERSSRGLTLVRELADVARESGKPVVAFTTVSGGVLDPDALAVLDSAGISLLQGPDEAAQAIGHVFAYGRFLRAGRPTDGLQTPGETPTVPAGLLERLARGEALAEHESKRLLAAYGVPVTREGLAATPEEAERLAAGLGYPVALKGAGPQLLHKTDLGLVRLNVESPAALHRAYAELWEAARTRLGPGAPGLEGILVQEMARPGVEVIVGAKQTEFGPVVIFGAGGILAELVKDASVRLTPVTGRDADAMISETRVGRLLDGVRGGEPLDRRGVAAVISALARLAFDLEAVVGEVEINPLIVTPSGVLAVDALAMGKDPAPTGAGSDGTAGRRP